MRSVGSFRSGVLELLQQERHSLEAVAAVAVAAVGEKADHGLVDLNAARRLRPVGGDRAFCALRRDRTRAVRDQKANKNLQRSCLGLRWFLAGQSQEEHIRHAPAAESFLARNAAQAAMLVVLGGNRGADHDAVQTQIPGQRLGGQARDALAHQGTPGDGRRDRRQDGVARRPRAKRFHEFQEQRFAAAIAHRLQHGLGTGVVGLGGGSRKERARALIDRDPAAIEGLIAGIQQAGMGKQVDQPGRAGERALDPLRTDDRRRRGHDGVRRIAGFARGLGRHQRRIADQIGFRGNRDVEHRAVIRAAISCTSGSAKLASSGSSARSSTE